MKTFALIPGHKDNPSTGWFNLDDFTRDIIDQIKIGSFQIGNFGDEYQREIDKFAAHYPIPNPWASSLLFDTVMKTANHPLRDTIIKHIINLLFQTYVTFELEVKLLRLNEISESFKPFWDLLPKSIVFNNGQENFIIFLEDRSRQIVGGISNTTLCWSAQYYVPEKEIEILLKDERLIKWMGNIKLARVPAGDLFDIFWSHFREINTDTCMPSMGNWWEPIKEIPLPPENEHFFFNGKCIFDEDDIAGRKSLNADFIRKIKAQLNGMTLPENRGDAEWCIFEDLFSDKIIDMEQISNTNDAYFFKGTKLFPINENYLRFLIKDSSSNLSNIFPDNYTENLGWATCCFNHTISSENRIFKQSFTKKIIKDRRTLAIWPPFISELTPIYITEYLIDGNIEILKELEFFDINGEKIKSVKIVHSSNERRVYCMGDPGNPSDFPYYIKITTPFEGKDIVGFLQIRPKKQHDADKTVIVGLDFGSSNTTVAYIETEKSNIDEIGSEDWQSIEPKIMTFKKSSPIIFSKPDLITPTIEYFLPRGISENCPESEREWEKIVTWMPFRTIWMPLDNNDGDYSFIKSGTIPLSINPSLLNQMFIDETESIKDNLKWVTDYKFRRGFLNHLLMMIFIE